MTIAHAGHWLVQIAYFLPVVLFLLWLAWTVVRDRRRNSGGALGEPAHDGEQDAPGRVPPAGG